MTLQVSYTDFLRRAGSTAQREKRRYINSSNGQTQFEKPMILIRMAHRKGLQIPPKQHSLSSIINNTSRHYPRLRNKRNAKNLQVSHKTTILLRRPGTSCIIGKWRHVMKNSIINNNNYSSLSQSVSQTDRPKLRNIYRHSSTGVMSRITRHKTFTQICWRRLRLLSSLLVGSQSFKHKYQDISVFLHCQERLPTLPEVSRNYNFLEKSREKQGFRSGQTQSTWRWHFGGRYLLLPT